MFFVKPIPQGVIDESQAGAPDLGVLAAPN